VHQQALLGGEYTEKKKPKVMHQRLAGGRDNDWCYLLAAMQSTNAVYRLCYFLYNEEFVENISKSQSGK
jgi:hypothetical protein